MSGFRSLTLEGVTSCHSLFSICLYEIHRLPILKIPVAFFTFIVLVKAACLAGSISFSSFLRS